MSWKPGAGEALYNELGSTEEEIAQNCKRDSPPSDECAACFEKDCDAFATCFVTACAEADPPSDAGI